MSMFHSLLSMGGWPSPVAIGDIYNATTWSSLTDFTANGTSGASIVSNKIRFSGGAASSINGLFIGSPASISMLEKVSMEIIFTVSSAVNSSSNGLAFQFFSINSWTGQKHTIALRWNGTDNVTTGGTVRILRSTDQVTYTLVSASSRLTFANGDRIKLTATRNYFTYTVTAENLTNPNSVSQSETVDASSSYAMNNAYKYLMNYAGGGTYDIDTITLTSSELKNINLLCIGDSKTNGRQANVYTARFADLLKADYPTIATLGGPSDRTLEVVQYVDLITLLNPRQVLISMGRNDLAFGVSSGTWQANLTTLQNLFISNGVQSIAHLVMEEPLSIDQTDLKTYITGQGWNLIDATGLTLAADNIHPNVTGHGEVYTQVKAANFIN